MSNDLKSIDYKSTETIPIADVDGLIKLIIAIMLATMSCYLQDKISIGLLSVYLLCVTFLSKIKPRILIISASSYLLIVLMPYLFGLFISSFISSFALSNVVTNPQGTVQIFLRLFRLLIIWYVSILYFHTTPMQTVLGLLDKLLTPLKLVGIPVADFLKVVMCSTLELKETGSQIKKSLKEDVRLSMRGHRRKFKINMKGLSQIIVSLIVNSFEKVDKIENYIKHVKSEDLYYYNFKLTNREVVVVSSFILFSFLILMVEKGYWL